MMEDNVTVALAGASEGEVLTEMFREDGEAPAAPERDIQLITAEIQFFKRQAGQAVYEIGRCLLEAKAQLKHGEWLPWLRDEVAFSEASAQRYMRLAREYGKSRIVTDLGAGKALELLALPESQREEFVEENDVSGMTREQLRQAIRERDEASVLAARERVRAETAEQSRTKMEEDMKALKALHAAAVETQREKEEALAKAEAELKDLRSRPVEVAVETKDAAPEQIEAAKAEGAKAAEAKAKAEFKKLREELKAAKERTEDAQKQMEEAREAAEKARKLAAASQEEGMVRFKLLFSSAQETVNRMAEELEQAPEESRDKLRRAMLALADAIRKAVGEGPGKRSSGACAAPPARETRTAASAPGASGRSLRAGPGRAATATGWPWRPPTCWKTTGARSWPCSGSWSCGRHNWTAPPPPPRR